MAYAQTLALPSIGQANLNPSRYALIKFPVPPMSEQLEIVRHLMDKSNEINQLDLRINQSVDTLAEYRSALVTSAVTGQISELR